MEDISRINDKIWKIGEQRAKIIAPLAERNVCSRTMVLEAASKLELSTRYVYKLIQNYRQSHGLITSIIPQKPNGGKGRSRLFRQQEDIINETIDKFYLNSQKLSAAKVIEEIRKQCFEKQINSPSEITIRRRLHSISLELLKKRGDDRNKLITPITGKFPEVSYPLDVVQIDHTLVDIIIVDPIERLPIGRPYVTLLLMFIVGVLQDLFCH